MSLNLSLLKRYGRLIGDVSLSMFSGANIRYYLRLAKLAAEDS